MPIFNADMAAVFSEIADLLEIEDANPFRVRAYRNAAHPARLGLSDQACRMAKSEGVLVSLNSDAHSALQLDNLDFGIGQARRGWLAPEDVLNTRSLE